SRPVRLSFTVCFCALAALLLSTLSLHDALPIFGLLSGYYRGALDELIMRVTDAVLSFPFLILAIALAAALGPSLTNAMIAIGIRSEEHTSELQSRENLVCRLLLEKKKLS